MTQDAEASKFPGESTPDRSKLFGSHGQRPWFQQVMKRRTSRRFQPTMTPGLDQLESRQLLSSGFQVVTSPAVTGASLSAVSAVSPTDIWAVGSDSTGPLIENFNGTSWSVVAAPTPAGASSAEFSAVSALASNNVWAVGSSVTVNSSGVSVSSPLVEHYNGTSWSIQTTPATGGSLNAVAVVSPTDVWAVGGTGSADLIENLTARAGVSSRPHHHPPPIRP